MKITDLKQRRGALVKEMRNLLDKAGEENRDLSADEQKKYNDLEKDVDRLGSQITQLENLDTLENSLRGDRDNDYRPGVNDKEIKEPKGKSFRSREDYQDAFINGYARRGKNGMSPTHYNALEEGTVAEGGYLVPEEFEMEIVKLLDLGNPIRAAVNASGGIIRTASDRNIPVETDDGAFTWIDEEGAYQEDDPAFARVVLGANKEGGIVKVSEELLQDSMFDLQSYLRDLAVRRYNNLEDLAFGNGDGSSKPTGLFATATVGGVSLTGITGSASVSPVITDDDIVNTFHALKRVYRPRATWLTSDTMVKMIRKLKDATNERYLWQPGLADGQPDRLLGRPIIVTEGYPTLAVSVKSIMFGDFSQYRIVDRLGMAMQRLNELYAENGQIGFKFMKRVDGKLIDPKAFTFFKHGAAA